MEIHKKIKQEREKQKLTQSTMAEKLNMSLSGYSKIERGISKPSIRMLERIADALEIDVYDLLSLRECIINQVVNNQDNIENNNTGIYCGNGKNTDLETELKLAQAKIQHQIELLAEKDKSLADKEREIQNLTKYIALLEKSLEKQE